MIPDAVRTSPRSFSGGVPPKRGMESIVGMKWGFRSEEKRGVCAVFGGGGTLLDVLLLSLIRRTDERLTQRRNERRENSRFLFRCMWLI